MCPTFYTRIFLTIILFFAMKIATKQVFSYHDSETITAILCFDRFHSSFLFLRRIFKAHALEA